MRPEPVNPGSAPDEDLMVATAAGSVNLQGFTAQIKQA